jgi:adrenodoxin-NADP+ reductase
LQCRIRLKNCFDHFSFQSNFTGIQEVIPTLSRPKKRLAELLAKSALEPPTQKQIEIRGNLLDKSWNLKLLRTPKEILADQTGKRVGAIALQVNRVYIFCVL